jgi:hypothetical protein
VASFAVLGIVIANIVMIFPDLRGIGWGQIIISVVSIILSAAVSFGFTVACGRLKEKLDSQPSDSNIEKEDV